MANQTRTNRVLAGTVALVAVVGVACKGPSNGLSGPTAETAVVQVSLQRAGSGAVAQVVADWFASTTGVAARIDLATVDSLPVTLDRIEFLPAVQEDGNGEGDGEGDGDGNGDTEAQWMSLDVEDVRIDLLALPTTEEAGIILVTGELPLGDYERVRLFVKDPMLWLNTPLQIGNAQTYEAEVGHAVTIPSGDQTGIKTDQGFSIAEGEGDVLLIFDENATLANVHGTGNGKVMMAPVLRVANGQ